LVSIIKQTKAHTDFTLFFFILKNLTLKEAFVYQSNKRINNFIYNSFYTINKQGSMIS